MPYTKNETSEQTKAIDRCIEGVMKKGKPKEKAIPICISAIKGSGSLLNLQAATEEDILTLQAQLADSPDILAQASLPTNAILKFEGACLARAETNSNGDGITDEGIAQLASTIRLMPLTEEHEKQPRGIFTKGYTNEDSTECLVSGFIWAGHFKSFADEVQSGARKLSMDAEAALAVCSVCGAAFTNTMEYCAHIRHRKEGAVRWLYDLTAVAGGAVKYPAGTGTVFPGKEGFTVISHKVDKLVPKRGGSVTNIGGNRMKIVCSECGHEHEVATDAEKIQTELDAKLQELQDLQTKADEAQVKNDELQASVSNLEAQVDGEKRVVDRFAELAAEAGVDFAKEALPSLRKADDDVFKTLVAMAGRMSKGTEAPSPQVVIASDGDPPPDEAGDTWNISV